MNSDFGLLPEDLEIIRHILAQEPTVERAIIFGSRAKGNYKTGSDVDIALQGPHITSETVSHIRYQLNEETLMPYKFDVLNYHTIQEPALIEHIDRAGIVFYEKNQQTQ